MADVLSSLQTQIGELFGANGFQGMMLTSTASIELKQEGGFDPSSANISPEQYYDPELGTFSSPTPPLVRLIPMTRLSASGQDGSEVMGTNKFLMLPWPNLDSNELVNTPIQVGQHTYSILAVKVVGMGPVDVVWELTCR